MSRERCCGAFKRPEQECARCGGDLLARARERVDAHTDRSAGPEACWPWTGTINSQGYASTSVQGATVIVSRWLLGDLRGEPLRWDEEKELACHTCDNPPCVNPAHLYIGSPQDNQRDAVERGQWSSGNVIKTQCKRGHEFTEENTRINPRGERVCRACDRELQRLRRAV